jgi:hypothetical protein
MIQSTLSADRARNGHSADTTLPPIERDSAASQSVYNFTEKDRYGLDDRSRILLTVKDGKYVLAK